MRMTWLLLVASILVATGSPLTVSSQEVDRQPQPEHPGTPHAHGLRFEGYLFLDADGRPLPFQSDEGVENYLSTASVVSVGKIPVGVSRPKKVLLAGEGLRVSAVFKDINVTKKNVRDPPRGERGKFYLTWRDSYEYDVAAYYVDRLLGLERVPPIVVRKVKGSTGSLQIWLEQTITENERRSQGFEPPEIARFNQQRETMRLFDNLVANRDSNLGNSLIDRNWRLWFIDCSRCFGTSPELLYAEAVTHCERRVWRALRELNRSEAEPVLSPLLERAEIDALFKRRDKLVEHIQALIDQWGEELVLFDQRPPTTVAPWVSSD